MRMLFRSGVSGERRRSFGMKCGALSRRRYKDQCPAVLAAIVFLGIAIPDLLAEIPHPTNAPPALTPAEEQRSFRVPEGFRMQLIASEPLITEPTGVCWDEHGQLFVCELHGYNLEGQLEIEEMNKSGRLDTKVQRIQADEKFKRLAEAGTFGVVKALSDRNRDGLMDHAEVISSNLPPAYGICPAREGLIVACAPHIVFLKKSSNGVWQSEVLFTGFKTGALERGINSPQWGPDGWIYFGRGWGAGKITGPHLKQAVALPNTDFRIRPDGSAIEPVTGGGHTIGFAFTPEGDRFFTTTWKHSLYAVPIAWRYFERNPDAATPSLEADAADYTTVFPLAPVHPWKKSRSNDPGWKELYGKYGVAESAENGYFTSCCSPLVYQDAAFPSEFRGNLFACEPAQSLVHRAVIERVGPALRVSRPRGEERKEFLASTDSWFRPVSLAHAPDGAVWIVDMYREIIEDYSAVPRFMQQQYGVNHGFDRGRLWRLAHDKAPKSPGADMSQLSAAALAKELGSPHFWRRQTAERLLRGRQGEDAPALTQRRGKLTELNASTSAGRAVELLRQHDQSLTTNIAAARRVAEWITTVQDERVLLQAALSLGYSSDTQAFAALVRLARNHADVRWMPVALMTGLHHREVEMLRELLAKPGSSGATLFEPLCASLGARRDSRELTAAFEMVSAVKAPAVQAACLKGFKATLKTVPLSTQGQTALKSLLAADDHAVRGLAMALAAVLKLNDSGALAEVTQRAADNASNPQLSSETRLAAIALLGASDDTDSAKPLLRAWPSGTPVVRVAVVDALLAKRDRLNALIEALEKKTVAVSALNASQRTRLLERADSHQRPRVESVFSAASKADFAATFQRFVAALSGPIDAKRGGELFEKNCASCHRVKNEGIHVGPDLNMSLQRADETLLRDILAPSELISSSYETYRVTTKSGEDWSGVLVAESATSVTLRGAGGQEQTVLRRDIADLGSSAVSLMPEGFGEALTPQDCADLIGWLRATLKDGSKR